MVRFDDSVEIAAAALKEAFTGQPPDTTIVRDLGGLLSVVLPDDALDERGWGKLSAALDAKLEKFSSGIGRVLLRRRDLIDPSDVLASPDRVPLTDHRNVWLVDRLLTNQDWLRAAIATEAHPPIAVAYSIKGGVGRSTAFAMLSWYLARQGKRVLVMDLDLEAPGIGSLMLDQLPNYGLVDWFVEALVDQADANLFEGMMMQSPLARDTTGIINVIPAFGDKTRDYVAKLGRIYVPTMGGGGILEGFAPRLYALLRQAGSRREPPDVILLDTRAGLHDIGAAAVTQIGAEVFMFARNDDQAWDAYKRLFAHLRSAKTIKWGMPDEDLRWRLKMVGAQVEPTEAALAHWINASYLAWSEFYDAESLGGEIEENPQIFDRDDEAAPHFPLPIVFNPRVRDFNVAVADQRPEWAFVEATFGRFLRGAEARLFPTLGSHPIGGGNE